jgi:hypothetical protein
MRRDSRPPRLKVTTVWSPELAGAGIDYDLASIVRVLIAAVLRALKQRDRDGEDTQNGCVATFRAAGW